MVPGDESSQSELNRSSSRASLHNLLSLQAGLASDDHDAVRREFITPNIALWPYGDRKPLTSYFKSLEVLKGLNIQTVLPGHHKVYRTADQRIEQLKVHHRDLLEKIENSLMGKLSAFDLAARVFGTAIFRETRFVLHKMLAQQEILSHLQYLASTGQVLKHEEDRVYWQIAPLP